MKSTSESSKRMNMREYRSQLAEYDDAYLRCRSLRHSWEVLQGFTAADQSSGHTVRTLECQRCAARRVDHFKLSKADKEPRLERMYSTYTYPAGFAIQRLPKSPNLGGVMRYEAYMRALVPKPKTSQAHEGETQG